MPPFMKRYMPMRLALRIGSVFQSHALDLALPETGRWNIGDNRYSSVAHSRYEGMTPPNQM